MRLLRRTAREPRGLASERGFLELAGREDGIPLREAFLRFRDLVSADMEWADSRKARFRASASYAKVAALILTGASTVVLGIPAIPERAAIALPMVALVTLIGGLEPFYNWRSRWVLMEDARYRLNRIRDEMDYYLVTTLSADLDRERLGRFFAEQQDIWYDVSRQLAEFRKLDRAQPGASVTMTIDGRSSLSPQVPCPQRSAVLGVSRLRVAHAAGDTVPDRVEEHGEGIGDREVAVPCCGAARPAGHSRCPTAGRPASRGSKCELRAPVGKQPRT